jgi:hypothetical protein
VMGMVVSYVGKQSQLDPSRLIANDLPSGRSRQAELPVTSLKVA